jgi:hypothetical protein
MATPPANPPILDRSVDILRDHLVKNGTHLISIPTAIMYIISIFILWGFCMLQFQRSYRAISITEHDGKSKNVWNNFTKSFKVIEETVENVPKDQDTLSMEQLKQVTSEMEIDSKNLRQTSTAMITVSFFAGVGFLLFWGLNHFRTRGDAVSSPWPRTPVARKYGYLFLNIWILLILVALVTSGSLGLGFANSMDKMVDCLTLYKDEIAASKADPAYVVKPCNVPDFNLTKFRLKGANAFLAILILLTLIPIIYIFIDVFTKNTFARNKQDMLGPRLI